MVPNTVSVRKRQLRGNLKYNGVTLLTYRIDYPEFLSLRFPRCLLRINRFYRDRAVAFQRYCETELFPLAVAQYQDDVQNNYPVRVFEVIQDYQITCLSDCVISIYFDQYQYTGGAHGNTVRKSQTWNLQSCTMFQLERLVFCPPNYKTFILRQVAAEIRKNPEIYFDNYEELIAETFNKNSFYCTPRGIVVYYQQYDIAPYSSGIREFLIPYSLCVLDPRRLCAAVRD